MNFHGKAKWQWFICAAATFSFLFAASCNSRPSASCGNTAEAGLYRATLGDGGFEKGMAWVNAQGCPVKLSLDSQVHLNNGSVDKVHYEIEMVKK